jgi:hypothetical protein
MKRLLLLGMLLSPLAASAECKVRSAEPFKAFFESFKSDKRFADSRTQYPLTSIKYQDDGVQDQLIPVESRIEKSMTDAAPPLATYALQNDLRFTTTSLKKSEAVVRMDHAVGSDALIFDYHFVRKGACWYLRWIEDHSIS